MKNLFLSLLVVLIFSAEAFGHSPSKMAVQKTKDGIDLVVYHSVEDPVTHYVKKITVKINGKDAAEKEFTSQTDAAEQKHSFKIKSLHPKDVLEITAYCSRYGDLTKKITIE